MLTADRLAQLVEDQATVREVVGSKIPAGPTLRRKCWLCNESLSVLSSLIRTLNCRPRLTNLQCSQNEMGRKTTHTPLEKSRAESFRCCGQFSVTNKAHIDTSCITETIT